MSKQIIVDANDAVGFGKLTLHWSENSGAISPLALDFEREGIQGLGINLPKQDAKKLALFILENL